MSNGANPDASGFMRVTREAIAYGEEQSIRILPSWSSVMKRPARVDLGVHDRQVQPVPLRDRAPVGNRCAAERVGADADVGRPDRVHADDRRQVLDVVAHEVVGPDGRLDLGGVGTLHPGEVVAEQVVGAVLDPSGGLGAGRAPVRRVVLEAAVTGRVVRRRDDDAVGEPVAEQTVEPADRVRDGGGRGVAVGHVHEDADPVGDEHLQRAVPGGQRQRVRVAADEQRAGDALAGPELADRLRDRPDMAFVEGPVQARPAVT